MEWIQGMNAAVNYIEEHILEEPDLNQLGKLAGCSAHHFQRIFTYIGGLKVIKEKLLESFRNEQDYSFMKGYEPWEKLLYK